MSAISLPTRLLPQPGVAIVLGALVGAMLFNTTPQIVRLVAGLPTLELVYLLACFTLAVIAELTTVHVNYHSKATLGGPAVLLLVVLLPLPLSALVACLARFTACAIARQARQSYWSDVVTNAARSGLVALSAAGFVAFSGSADLPLLARILISMLLVMAGDSLTAPLELAPVTGERPLQLLRLVIRDVITVEGPLYVLAALVVVLLEREPLALPLLIVPLMIVYRLIRSSRQVQSGTLALLENLADTVDLRDPYTGGHSRRVAEYAAGILRELKLEGEDYTLIVSAARVHDVGKIGIPDSILHKPGRLTVEERRQIEAHPVLGATLIARHADFARGVAIVRHHHERIDGGGYPDGLAGAAIPFGARVIAVADTYDALTSDRPYRRGMTPQDAAQVLIEGMGTQWQTDLVVALLHYQGMADLLNQPRPAPTMPNLTLPIPPSPAQVDQRVATLR